MANFKYRRKKKNGVKYPYIVYFRNGRSSPIPSQHKFKNDWLKHHGCSTVAMYILFRYAGKKKSMKWCINYARHTLKDYKTSKLRLKGVYIGLKKQGVKCTYDETPEAAKMRKALKEGYCLAFEEKDPIHTVVLYYDNVHKRVMRFSDGTVKPTSVDREMKKKSTTAMHRGVIVVKAA